MKASFDGARLNLASAYNSLVRSLEGVDMIEYRRGDKLDAVCAAIGGLLCMYDDSDPDDCNDLSERIPPLLSSEDL